MQDGARISKVLGTWTDLSFLKDIKYYKIIAKAVSVHVRTVLYYTTTTNVRHEWVKTMCTFITVHTRPFSNAHARARV